MDTQTHYPDFVGDIRQSWQPYTQQNVDRMSLRDLVLDMIETVKELEQENARQSAQWQVEYEANKALRSKLNEAQRELGRMEWKVEQLARKVE